MARRDAITDVPGIRVGHWTDRRAITGCTAVVCLAGAIGGADIRGAAPGTRETDLLRSENLVEEVHAVLLTGGSAFGLEAATGVVRYLREQRSGLAFGPFTIPIVPAAVLFDLGVGHEAWPDAEAGYLAARRARSGTVAEGSVGAGTGATVAKLAGPDRRLKGGLGTASERFGDGLVVGAIVAVNAVGLVRDPSTAMTVAGPRGEAGGFLDAEEFLRRQGTSEETQAAEDTPATNENTTLAVVATNAKLTKVQANRLATVCHDGFARAIWPVHTRGDGDAIFTLATGERALEPPAYLALEGLATRAVERAIVRGVEQARGVRGVPSVSEWRGT
ncbi:MAG: P1 family peptidase [Dehalococcoidia bacterium]